MFELILPPLPVNSTAPNNIYGALERHPLVKWVNTFCESLLALAEWKVDLKEADGATSNDRYYNFVLARLHGAGILSSLFICCNHGGMNAMTKVVLASGSWKASLPHLRPILNNLYAMSLFVRMRGNFVKIIGMVKQVVQEAKLLGSPRPEGLRQYSEELVDLLCCNYGRTRSDNSDKAKANYKNNCESLFALVDGALWSKTLEVHADPSDFASWVNQVTSLILSVILGHMPTLPSSGSRASSYVVCNRIVFLKRRVG